MLKDHIQSLIGEYDKEMKLNTSSIDFLKQKITQLESSILDTERQIMDLHHKNRDILNVIQHLEDSLKKQQ